MKVLIIGYGYVGSAVGSIFKKSEIVIIDPKLNKNKISNFKNNKFDIVFVCVDTPLNEKFKTLNCILSELNIYLKDSVVCCKSTALPSYYKAAYRKFKNLKLVFSPEYLSHHSNIKDFKSQTFCILGGNKEACNIISRVLKNRIKSLKNVFFTDISTAAFIKYAENSFLAYKITFFNELKLLHKLLKIPSTFNTMKSLLLLDKRIGSSHTDVPGRDGKNGWGGHCLPKDVTEFFNLTNSKLLKHLLNINKTHRNDKFF